MSAPALSRSRQIVDGTVEPWPEGRVSLAVVDAVPGARRSRPARAATRRDDEPARHWTRRNWPFALAATLPWAVIAFWVWLEAPDHFERQSGGFLLAGAFTVGIVGLSMRAAVFRSTREIRQLYRVVRKIETDDVNGNLPGFHEPDLGRIARAVAALGERLRRAEERFIDLTASSRRDKLRQDSVLESQAMENARLRAETSVLHSFGGLVNRAVGEPQIFSELISNLRGKVDFVGATVYMLDDVGALVPRARCDAEHRTPMIGNFVQHTSAARSTSTRTVAGWVLQVGTPVRVEDTQADSRCIDLGQDVRSVLAVPLRARQSVLGVVEVEHPHPFQYDDSDERILSSLANQAAIAVENVRLFEEAAKVQALREIDRLKSELLSTVSHEFRTPLASIKGYAGTLLRTDVEWDSGTQREFLQIIEEESDHLGDLIEDLLQMSQIEAGHLSIDPAPMRVPRIVQRIVKKARTGTPPHQFVVQFAPDFPEIVADQRRIEQVLRNLIENAVKYSPEGGSITIRGTADASSINVAVTDEGIGIAPEDVPRVFDRFYRADSSAVRHAGGTGLGLSICEGIIQRHGGRIWVESRIGTGSTFQFTLPRTAASNGQDDGLAHAANQAQEV